MHAALVDRLAYVDISFTVHRHRVRVHEFSNLVTRAAEAAEHLAARAVHDVDLLVDLVDDKHTL